MNQTVILTSHLAQHRAIRLIIRSYVSRAALVTSYRAELRAGKSATRGDHARLCPSGDVNIAELARREFVLASCDIKLNARAPPVHGLPLRGKTHARLNSRNPTRTSGIHSAAAGTIAAASCLIWPETELCG